MTSNYVTRTLSTALMRAGKSFPAILVTGPRQVGKTTLLRHLLQPDMQYVTLDSPSAQELAKSDPPLFLQRYAPPVIIDEIQYAPELLPYIKMHIDNVGKAGMFWLTGSQQFHMMHNVSESLAGRIGIFKLLGLSLAEELNRATVNTAPFLPEPQQLQERFNADNIKKFDLKTIYQKIWRGSFPFMVLKDLAVWEAFYDSYIQTYLQRDVRELAKVGDEAKFMKFLRATAARTGQLVNYADLARDAQISEVLVKEWLAILEASAIIYILEPYHTTQSKRLVKTPKLYFLDTGLCCFLLNWQNPEVLESGAFSGAILETFVIAELLKSYWHNGKKAYFYFYRDRDKKEIDLLIEHNGKLYPLEIKKTASPKREDYRHFETLAKLNIPLGSGGVLCLAQEYLPLTRSLAAIPFGLLI